MAANPSSRQVNSASGGTTATAKQQLRPGQPDATKQARQPMPVSSPQRGGGSLQTRQQTHAVTGPSSWENGRDPVAVVGGTRLAGSSPADAAPSAPPCPGDCGGGH